MLISLCIPCHERAHDLARSMRALIAAANESAPAEIAVLDYNSSDDVWGAVQRYANVRLKQGNTISYHRYEGRDHYHKAHAWNLAVRSSGGEYVAMMGADAVPAAEFLIEARRLIAQGCEWMRGRRCKGIVIVRRSLFDAIGGYDERMEWYGSEDRDLEARLKRSGAKFGLMRHGLIRTIPTPPEEKVCNYRLPLSKAEMCRRNRAVYEENLHNRVMVANAGQEWGAG